MFYLLFKNQWVEHELSYLNQESDDARLEATKPGLSGKFNIAHQRFRLKDGVPVVTLADIMSKEILHVTPDTPLSVCRHIMETEGIHHLAVFNDGQFSGLISDRDINLVARLPDASKMKASQVTSTIILAASESTTLGRTCQVFLKEGISALPVLNEDLNISGIVTLRDMIRVLGNLLV